MLFALSLKKEITEEAVSFLFWVEYPINQQGLCQAIMGAGRFYWVTSWKVDCFSTSCFSLWACTCVIFVTPGMTFFFQIDTEGEWKRGQLFSSGASSPSVDTLMLCWAQISTVCMACPLNCPANTRSLNNWGNYLKIRLTWFPF